MNERQMIDWRLVTGLAASLILHVAAAAYIGMDGFSRSSGDAALMPPPEPDMPEIRPGIDNSRAVTISWIGYEDPTPHEAKLSSVDQPALMRGPAPEASMEQTASAPPTQQSITPKPLAETAEAQPLPAIPLPSRSLDELLASLEEAKPEAKPTPEQPPKPSEAAETAQTEQVEDDAPQPASTAGGGPREATPTSRTKPVEIRPGDPAAMEGIEFDTVGPKFTTITRLTAAPGNPVARITFNTAGKVTYAEIIQTSGYQNVDRPVLDALYVWRAKGKKLEELRASDPDQKITFDFRILLR